MKLYQAIVNNETCLNSDQWRDAAECRNKRILALLPSGSGFDSGTRIESVSDTKIVFNTAYHHMDDSGFYCGWTEHKVVVTASLLFGISIRISGKNKRDIKDYIAECFHQVLTETFEWLNHKENEQC